MKPNMYLLLKGPPGIGKNYVLHECYNHLSKMGIEIDKIDLDKHSFEIKSVEPLMNINMTKEDKPDWKHYTVGFCFDEKLTKVLLIRKAKPQWQAGRFNGVGGSFEAGETPEICMWREFKEETGYTSIHVFEDIKWTKFAEGEIRCHQGDCFLHYMVGICNKEFVLCSSNNEVPEWIDIDNLPIDIVPNLAWLIPMAKVYLTKPWWSEIATFRTII